MGLKPEGQDAALEAMLPGMSLLIVIEDRDIHCLSKLADILSRKQVEAVEILVLRQQDKQLFLAVVELVDFLPWQVGK